MRAGGGRTAGPTTSKCAWVSDEKQKQKEVARGGKRRSVKRRHPGPAERQNRGKEEEEGRRGETDHGCCKRTHRRADEWVDDPSDLE